MGGEIIPALGQPLRKKFSVQFLAVRLLTLLRGTMQDCRIFTPPIPAVPRCKSGLREGSE